MRSKSTMFALLMVWLFSLSYARLAEAQKIATTPATAAKDDSSYIDRKGTAHITRLIPVPLTISPESRQFLSRQVSDAPSNPTIAEQRATADAYEIKYGAIAKQYYPVETKTEQIAGVSVRVVTPAPADKMKHDRVLMNFHGGGFDTDMGSLTETIPIASLTQTKVVAVLYRLAPEYKFPVAIDEGIIVYRELLKTYKPENIGVYGTSAGASLTAEFAVRVRQLGLPLPGALGLFACESDFSKVADTSAMYTFGGLDGNWGPPPPPGTPLDPIYTGKTDPIDPVLSPYYAKLDGMPPTLFVSSTRDTLLSQTALLERQFLHAHVPTQMVIFEALPHAFWNNAELPESREADEFMADFLARHTGH
jgi:monoterpene epsilon-lactone hydrolase